ncbi:MAG TPA: pantoate--beta-alanine ligase [Ktedonobacterales bacterium]
MRVIEAIAELEEERGRWQAAHRAVGFVPTMGYLHAGHLALAHRARVETERVVVSIFVNPAQFAPSEDLARYPRNLPGDLALLEAAGVDIVFVPAAAAIYPAGYATYIVPGGLVAERLEAASRPSHFRGVATVVAKLFMLVQPDVAYFGQKDAQQLAVLRQMVRDLNIPVRLEAVSIVREPDGLAMSSRNAYLGAEDRAAATVLRRALEAGRARFSAGVSTDPGAVAPVIAAMRQVIAAEPRATLDYADVCDPATFAPLAALGAPALLAIAARVGPARLIDNYLLRPEGTWDTGAPVA